MAASRSRPTKPRSRTRAALTGDLETELQQTRKRLTELTVRVPRFAETMRSRGRLAARGDAAGRDASGRKCSASRALCKPPVSRLAELQAADRAPTRRSTSSEMRRAAHLQNEAVASKAQVDNLRRERDRLRQRSDVAADQPRVGRCRVAGVAPGRIATARAACSNARQRLQEQQTGTGTLSATARSHQRTHLASCARTAAAWRAESRCWKADPKPRGARHRRARGDRADRKGGRAGRGPRVIGMIADFLTVKREYAPLIDLALGDWAQRFVVRDHATAAASAGGPQAAVIGARQLSAARVDCRRKPKPSRTAIVQALRSNRLGAGVAVEPSQAGPMPRGHRRRSIRAWSHWRSIWCRASIRSWPTCRRSFWAAR